MFAPGCTTEETNVVPFILLHEAEVEFWEAVAYYEKREPGLAFAVSSILSFARLRESRAPTRR